MRRRGKRVRRGRGDGRELGKMAPMQNAVQKSVLMLMQSFVQNLMQNAVQLSVQCFVQRPVQKRAPTRNLVQLKNGTDAVHSADEDKKFAPMRSKLAAV